MSKAAVSTHPVAATVLPNLDVIIRGLLYVYVFSLPFKNLLFVERNGFIILVALLVLWCVVNRRHFFTRTPLDLPFLAFICWVGFTVPFATFPAYSFKEFAKLLQQGLIFYVVVYFFRDESHRVRLMQVLMGASLIVSGYGVLEFMRIVGILQSDSKLLLLESVTSGEVWLSTYLVMVIPLCFALFIFEKSRHERHFALGATVMATVCLMLTFSRAGLFSLLCELWMFAILLKRRTLWVAAGVFSLAIVVAAVVLNHTGLSGIPGTQVNIRGVSTSSFVHRLDIWRFTLDELSKHPLFGIGYGKDNFQLVYGRLPEEVQPGHTPVLKAGTHNTFLDVALGAGIPALMLFVWLMCRIVIACFKALQKRDDPWDQIILLGAGVSVTSMLVRLSFDHMLIGTLAIQFWIIVALAMLVARSVDVGR